MPETSNVVRVTGVTKSFKLGKIEVQALKGVDLEIARGEYLSIMGPSGSGKSTLFNMIGGLDKPTTGKVFIDEVDIAQLDAYELAWLRCRKIGYIFQTFNIIQVMTALENVTLPMVFAGMNSDATVKKGMRLLEQVGLADRHSHKPFELAWLRCRKIGYIFQSFNLVPVLNVFENIEFPLLLGQNIPAKAERREWIEYLVDEVGLDQWMKHKPSELSGGQRQRVAIARALVTRPRIVLADEPTANLDSETGESIIGLMKKINADLGTTFIFSTHDPSIVGIADHVIRLLDGKVVENSRRGSGVADAEATPVKAR
jgi:putative ABC transport system ATP-binding protein